MLPRFDDVANDLRTAPTVAAVTEVWQRTIEAIGFLSFDYAFGQLETLEPQSLLDFRFDHYSATRAWTDMYFEKGYVTVDRASLLSLTRVTPWTYQAVIGRSPDSPLEREMIGEVRASGIRSGLGIPLHGLGLAAGLMHLGSTLPQAEFERLDREARPLAVLLSAYFHERMLALLEGAPADADRLSPRERECLLWVARGKTSWEIAAILGIAESTVNNILVSARRRLQVSTRAQAAAKAVATGQIVL